jgi:DUF971 family protein
MDAEPASIEADREQGTITIDWADGHRSRYPTALLRWACPCAVCKGEWGRPGRLASLSSLPPEELTLSDVQAVGSYAIMPIWASGHAEGIYSFEYLRELCPCEACAPTPGNPR